MQMRATPTERQHCTQCRVYATRLSRASQSPRPCRWQRRFCRTARTRPLRSPAIRRSHRCILQRPALVQLLLRKGANVDAADGDGATPLHHAARALSPKAVHALLAGGADAQRADASGTLPRDVDAVANGKDSLASSIRKHLERARQIRSEALEQRKSKAEQRKTEL